MSLKIANCDITALHDYVAGASYRVRSLGEKNKDMATHLHNAAYELHKAIETAIPRREFVRGYDPNGPAEGWCDACGKDVTVTDPENTDFEQLNCPNCYAEPEFVTWQEYTSCEGCNGFGIPCSSDGAPTYCEDCEPMFEVA